MYRKNVASQFIHFQGVDASTGGIKTGVTWTVRRCIDGTFAAGGGTVTEDGTTGWYKYAMSQADTNGNNIGFNFTGTGAIPQTVNIITTAADPTDAVRLGLTALPNAAAEAAGGLYTRGTGAGQINQPANGQVDANAVKLGGTTQTGRDVGASVVLAADQAVNVTKFSGTTVTGRDIGASVLLSSGTGAGQLDFTSGVVKSNQSQILGTAITETSGGLLAAAFKKFFDKASPTGTINSIPDAVAGAAGGLALVGSNVGAATSVTGAVGSVTAGVIVTTNNDKTGYGLSSAAVQAIWDALTSALTTAGSIGKWILDKLDVVVSTRLASASYTAPLDAAGVRAAVGLASANLDTQLSTIDDFLDTEIVAIKAKTDNLPSDPADASDVAGAFSTVNATLGTIAGYIDTEVGAIKAKTDNLPASPAATGDIPTVAEIRNAVLVGNADFPFPSTGILDDFNRADEGPPPSSNYGNGLAEIFGGDTEPGHEVKDEKLANTFIDVAGNHWIPQFNPDSEAYLTVVDTGGVMESPTFSSLALGARFTNPGYFTGANGYVVEVRPSGTNGLDRQYTIYRVDGGDSATSLATATESVGSSIGNDKYGIRCLGDRIILFGDTGDGFEIKLEATDSTYSSAGNIGFITDVGSAVRFEDFGGGNVVYPIVAMIADEVWDEDIVADHQTEDTAGRKLSQALILYEGS